MQPSIADQVEQSRLDQFRNVCRIHEISDMFASKLRQLEGYEIFVIMDDSGSMTHPVQNHLLNADPYGKQVTRWDEAKSICRVIIDIAALMDKSGIDFYLLNKPPVFGVYNHTQLEGVFEITPNGYTPIVPALRTILQLPTNDKKRLIIIITDGQPTGEDNKPDIDTFRDVLEDERSDDDHVVIVACTDEKTTMEYLNGWDKELERLDVADDYLSELAEVQAKLGKKFVFTFGDYIVKILLGSIDPEMDNLDELHRRCSDPNYKHKHKHTHTDTLVHTHEPVQTHNHKHDHDHNKKKCIVM